LSTFKLFIYCLVTCQVSHSIPGLFRLLKFSECIYIKLVRKCLSFEVISLVSKLCSIIIFNTSATVISATVTVISLSALAFNGLPATLIHPPTRYSYASVAAVLSSTSLAPIWFRSVSANFFVILRTPSLDSGMLQIVGSWRDLIIACKCGKILRI
jgi:hypothetical protein